MTNPSTLKPADTFDQRRGNAPEGTEFDTQVHYIAIPTTQEELDASRPPFNSRLKITKNSEAFDIRNTGFD